VHHVDPGETNLYHVDPGETNMYQNLDEIIDEIDTEIEDKEQEIQNAKEGYQRKNLKAEKKSLERKKNSLKRKAAKLIEVDGKLMVLLDTPDHNLLANIAPILSHDSYEHIYKYVDSNSGPITTKANIVRGFPILKQLIEVTRKELSR
jgi:hypothetical protein